VLLLHGADDPYVKRESITAFEDEMNGGNVDWEIVIYSHAVHGFTNPNNGSDPSKGAAYNEAADHRSWDDMKQFFAEIFKK
jgi:dienelactone hydrolase